MDVADSLDNYNKDFKNTVQMLEELANLVRQHIIEMIHEARPGHPGGSLSITDILTTLYFHIMRHNPEDPNWADRDRLVLSKGHGAPALYSVLAEAGYLPVEELKSLRKIGSRLQGHPSMRHLPGIDMSTGSLGQGLSAAVGMALGGKLDRKGHYIYVIMGDGETEEGSIWEAAMSATHYKLDHLIAFVDRNRLQIDGRTAHVMSVAPVREKWEGFGWNVISINGHDIAEIIRAVEEAKTSEGKPSVIIAHTIKGKGVSFMEGSLNFHGKAPNDEQYEIAMRELRAKEVSC
jgi:transketolase